jgi:hypothetical protein
MRPNQLLSLSVFTCYQMKKKLIFLALLFIFPNVFQAQDLIKITTPPAVTSRAHIEVQNPSTSSGTITFRFTPKGGVAQNIIVEIKKGKKAKKIAKKIESRLDSKLPGSYSATYRSKGGFYYVDIEKDTSTAADFDISNSLTVQGVAINIIK